MIRQDQNVIAQTNYLNQSEKKKFRQVSPSDTSVSVEFHLKNSQVMIDINNKKCRQSDSIKLLSVHKHLRIEQIIRIIGYLLHKSYCCLIVSVSLLKAYIYIIVQQRSTPITSELCFCFKVPCITVTCLVTFHESGLQFNCLW